MSSGCMVRVLTMALYSSLSLPTLICWPCLLVRPAFMMKRIPAITCPQLRRGHRQPSPNTQLARPCDSKSNVRPRPVPQQGPRGWAVANVRQRLPERREFGGGLDWPTPAGAVNSWSRESRLATPREDQKRMAPDAAHLTGSPGRRVAAVTLPLIVLLLGSPGVTRADEPTPKDDAKAVEFFEEKVRPVLVDHCYPCHSADTQVDRRAAARTTARRSGGRRQRAGRRARRPGREPAAAAGSRTTDPKRRMPPKKGEPLTEAQVADLTPWIKDGARWPAAKVARVARPAEGLASSRSGRSTGPGSRSPTRSRRPCSDAVLAARRLDRFVLAEARGGGAEAGRRRRPGARSSAGVHVRPDRAAADARRGRRVPRPTPTAGRASRRWSIGCSPRPQFGERWGRHWLDVARYGESTGSAANIPYPHAWRYRDYVIDAFNADKPFDRFVREQVAGDLLPGADDAERDRLLIATGFLALGAEGRRPSGSRSGSSWTTWTSRSTPSSRSVLGLTVALRPLPRPQVRPDPDDRLLRPGRHLHQHADRLSALGVRGKWAAAATPALHAPAQPSSAHDAIRRRQVDQAEGRKRSRDEGAARRGEDPAHAERDRESSERRGGIIEASWHEGRTSRGRPSPLAMGVSTASAMGGRTAVHVRGESRRSGRVPRGFPRSLERSLPDRVPDRPERPARAGAVADAPGQPADGPGDGQPRLAAPVRRAGSCARWTTSA